MSFRTASAVRNLLVAFRRRILKRNLLAPISSNIFPCWVLLEDQSKFFFTPPCLDLCLSRDGVSNMFEALIPDQPIDPVFPSEASAFSGFMAEHACYQRPGHADLKPSALARHHVNEIAACPGTTDVWTATAPHHAANGPPADPTF